MISLRGVSKTVSSGGLPLTILHPLDLEVPGGQCLAIVGPSGSGKSTLLGLIAGLDSPTSGQIEIAGTDITRLSEDDLARLRGPVGLDLGGRAPAETALAILAEIVAERYGGSGRPMRERAALDKA